MKSHGMLRPVVHVAKFVGTISVGLLTGLSYSLSTITYPALLHLPTAALAAQTNNYIRSNTRATQRILSTLATTALAAAFFLSPRRLRHPWLFYVAITCQAGASARVIDGIAARFCPALWRSSTASPVASAQTSPTTMGHQHGGEAATPRTGDDGLGASAVLVSGGPSSSSEELEQDVNGEVVTRDVERSRVREKLRQFFYGGAFVMSVVGIWGDFA